MPKNKFIDMTKDDVAPVFSYLKNNRWIFFVLLIYLGASVIKCNPMILLWDAADYILMGKYIFSLGNVGLWVSYRGPAWPCALGFLWKMGLDPIEAGRMFGVALGAGSLFLLYLAGKEFFGKKTAACAAFFLGFSPLFFVWGKMLFADIPAVFFSLLALVLYLKNRQFWAGLAASLAFLTRFDQGLLFGLFVTASFLGVFRKNEAKNIGALAAGFVLLLIPFFLCNYFFVFDILAPFKAGIPFFYTPLEGYNCGKFFYVDFFLKNEIFWVLFIPAGIYAMIKEKNKRQLFFGAIGGLFFLFYEIFPISQERYMIEVLPMFYLVASYGLKRVYLEFKNPTSKKILIFLVCVAGFANLLKAVFFQFPPPELSSFQAYALSAKGPLKGEVWITNPAYGVYGNFKIDKVINEPDALKDLKKEIKNAGLVFINVSEFFWKCHDDGAEKKVSDFLNALQNELHVEFLENNAAGGVRGAIFRRL